MMMRQHASLLLLALAVCTGHAEAMDLTVTGIPGNIGTPAPWTYGTYTDLVADISITNSIDSPVDTANGLRWVSSGWSLYNGTNLVQESVETQAVFQLTTNLTLYWLWTNTQVHLTTAAGPNGSLTADLTGWYTNTAPVQIEAVADTNYVFAQWTGDVPADQRRDSTLEFTMDAPRSVLAHFTSLTGELKQATGQTVWTNDAAWTPPGMPGPNDTVWLYSGTNTLTDPVWVGDVIVSNRGRIKFAGSWTALNARDVHLLTNATVSCETNFHWPNPVTNRVLIVCRNLTIDQGGLIDASYKGWGPTNGPGAGGYAAGNDGGGGGGYGGRGGRANNSGTGARGPTYGSAMEPVDPGSGGGRNISRWPPGAGGGLVQLLVQDRLVLDGMVNATGQAGTGGYCAGGSGGGILIVCNTFTGGITGKLLADGGAGQPSGTTTRRAGGGGGGRIAVWAGVSETVRRQVVDENRTNKVTISTNTHPSFAGTISVYRGEGYPSNNYSSAESGTIRVFMPPSHGPALLLIR